ncbi:MAG: alcohol dehydrogenase catalytic domain-containing protein [Candidatus Rokubacteria bacterium]|nr:alcohol dehydrogenase catalytic domain-containing protein [Candidatus Rokubacteria bacterium]MBI3826645.1 alcohol dehydrogenase catalytic domain-containing protein [Candidatus Rokubacteria bacterium]
MKAAVFRGGGRLAAEDWPRPAIGPEELLLRLRGCGLCGSDIAKFVAPSTKAPAVFGHELVGDVVEAGAAVHSFAAGDRVVAAHHVPCGACHYCARGSASMCRAFKASTLDPGGFAEYVRVPGVNVRHATFRVPDHVSDEAASFVEPLACCLRAMRRAPAAPGDVVVVAGLGSIGSLFVQLARRAGATVIGVDPIAARQELGRKLGAIAVAPDEAGEDVRARSAHRGADTVIVTGGGAPALPWAAQTLRDGGTVHYFAGGAGEALPLSLETLYQRELTITTTYSSSPGDLGEAFRLVTEGAIEVEALYSHRLPLDRLAEGIALMQSRTALKVYVTP